MSNQFDAEHTAAHRCQNAARYFAMAWAAEQEVWAEHGRDELRAAADTLGYDLVPKASGKPAAPPSPGDRMRVEHVAEDDR